MLFLVPLALYQRSLSRLVEVLTFQELRELLLCRTQELIPRRLLFLVANIAPSSKARSP